MKPRPLLVLGVATALALGCAFISSARAATISLHPVADTSILSGYPTYNFGGGTTLTAGGDPHGGRHHALMLFNLQSIPAGAIIDSVSLRLSVVRTPAAAVNSTFELERLTDSWAEGNGSDFHGSPAGPNQATWNNRFGTSGSPWATPGGDFVSTASATDSIMGNGSYTFNSTAGLVADVQDWLDNPTGNFGWILRSESELTARTIRRFASRLDSAGSPLLTVQYTLVPEPGACSLLFLGLLALGWNRRRG